MSLQNDLIETTRNYDDDYNWDVKLGKLIALYADGISNPVPTIRV